jgi:hypothetical protein
MIECPALALQFHLPKTATGFKRQLQLIETVSYVNARAIESARESLHQIRSEKYVSEQPNYDDMYRRTAAEITEHVSSIESQLQDLERAYTELSPVVGLLFEDVELIGKVIKGMDTRIKSIEKEVGNTSA